MFKPGKNRKEKYIRRNLCLEVEDNIDFLQQHDLCDVDSNPFTDPITSAPNCSIDFNELLMKGASVKTKHKKSRKKCNSVNPVPSISHSYETPASTSLNPNIDQGIMLLEETHPQVNFSSLGPSLRGSTNVMCAEFKIAFMFIWIVDSKGYDLKLLPFINCSSSSISTLNLASKKLCEKLVEHFEERMVKLRKKTVEERFSALSSFVVSDVCEEQITNELRKYLEKEQNLSNPMRRTLQKFNIDVKNSLDYFNLAQIGLVDERDSTRKNVCFDTAVTDENICPICFDEYCDNDVQMMTCGHKACRDCWKGLIRSSSMSGETKILCPAYKCNERLTLNDMAHLLFERSETLSDQDTRVLMKLTKFKIDDVLVDKSFIRCSTPSCCRVLKPKSFPKNLSSEIKYSSMCLCDCGAITCEECGQPSHFGLSCEAAKRVRREIATGHINKELQSLLWVHKNTTPCPRCNFPINKNGGCNHVRCSKCNYYFCWICGGDGTKCGAFSCHNRGIVTFGDEAAASYKESNVKIKNQMSLIKDFYNSVHEVEVMLRDGRGSFNDSQIDRGLVYEFKLKCLLMWMNGMALDKSISGSDPGLTIMNQIQSLKLMLKCIIQDGQNLNKFTALEASYTKNKSASNKKGKNSSKKSKNSGNDEVSFQVILEAMRLQAMNEQKLKSYVASVCQKVMTDLIKLDKDKGEKFVDKNNTSSANPSNKPLNERKKTVNAPWKGESRFLDLEDTTTKSKRKKKNRKVTPWKGKVKVATRRNHVLNNTR